MLLDLLSQLRGGEVVLEHFPASEVTTKLGINPFAAPACEISRLKSAHTELQTVFSGPTYNKLTSNTYKL